MRFLYCSVLKYSTSIREYLQAGSGFFKGLLLNLFNRLCLFFYKNSDYGVWVCSCKLWVLVVVFRNN